MKHTVIEISEDRLILIDSKANQPGEIMEIEIGFPAGAAIDTLQVKGEIASCEKLDNDCGSFFLIELKLQGISETDHAILQAYKVYLGKEKNLDKVFEMLDLKGLLEKLIGGLGGNSDKTAINEFLRAKMKNETFH